MVRRSLADKFHDATKGLGKVCLAILLSLFLVTLFEVWFYFFYVADVERDVTAAEIGDAANIMGLQLQSAMAGTKGSTIAAPLNPAEKETTLLRVEAYLDALSSALAPRLESEKAAVQTHNKPLLWVGMGMCGGVAVLMILCVLLLYSSAKKQNNGGQLLSKHVLTEIFMVLFGFIVYDFIFFHFIVRKYKPLSGGGFLQRAFTPVVENHVCLPAPSNNFAETLLRDAREMQAAIDAGSETAYTTALKQAIQTMGGQAPSPLAPPSTPALALDTSQCQELATLAASTAHRLTYGQDPSTQDLLRKLTACAAK